MAQHNKETAWLIRIREFLQQNEWGWQESSSPLWVFCPVCTNSQSSGHKPECIMSAIIKDTPPEVEKVFKEFLAYKEARKIAKGILYDVEKLKEALFDTMGIRTL